MERAEAEAILEGDRERAVALLMRVGELVEANRRLEARVAELERRLERSSRNSSLPPSQDPPSVPPRPKKPASGRKRGGQPGHEGTNRPLLPLERVDRVVERWPERCHACAHVFGEDERVDAAAVQRHQVSELPPIAVTVTEHRLHRLCCPACAAETRAELPAGVPRSAFGPRLQAAVATLAVRNRVSRRDTVELMDELFGVELSTGAIDALVERAGEALAEPHAWLHDQIRSASALNGDETGWRLRGGKRTLWGALTARAAVFRIAPDLLRGRAGVPRERRPGPPARTHRPPQARTPSAARARSAQEHQDEAPPPLRPNLLKHRPALWNFTRLDGVEPINNHVERGPRGAVIYRKLSLDSQSERGERTIERLLSAPTTCRLQRRSLFAYLTDVLTASIRGDPIPTLA